MKYILIQNLLTSKNFLYEYESQYKENAFEMCFEYLKGIHNNELTLKFDSQKDYAYICNIEKTFKKGLIWSSTIQKSYNIFKLSYIDSLNIKTFDSVEIQTEPEKLILSPNFQKIVDDFKNITTHSGYAKYAFL